MCFGFPAMEYLFVELSGCAKQCPARPCWIGYMGVTALGLCRASRGAVVFSATASLHHRPDLPGDKFNGTEALRFAFRFFARCDAQHHFKDLLTLLFQRHT